MVLVRNNFLRILRVIINGLSLKTLFGMVRILAEEILDIEEGLKLGEGLIVLMVLQLNPLSFILITLLVAAPAAATLRCRLSLLLRDCSMFGTGIFGLRIIG